MFGGEIPVRLPNVLEFAGCRVKYLHIARDIFVTIDFAELVECLIRDVSNVKFMVAYDAVRSQLLYLPKMFNSTNSQHVVFHVLEDGIAKAAIRLSSIAQAVSVMQIA